MTIEEHGTIVENGQYIFWDQTAFVWLIVFDGVLVIVDYRSKVLLSLCLLCVFVAIGVAITAISKRQYCNEYSTDEAIYI